MGVLRSQGLQFTILKRKNHYWFKLRHIIIKKYHKLEEKPDINFPFITISEQIKIQQTKCEVHYKSGPGGPLYFTISYFGT